jgi:hypothetical protein
MRVFARLSTFVQANCQRLQTHLEADFLSFCERAQLIDSTLWLLVVCDVEWWGCVGNVMALLLALLGVYVHNADSISDRC